MDLVYYSESGTTGEAGDPYTGLDRFGRIADQRWVDSSSSWVDLDRFQYGHDRNGNRLYEENLLDPTKSELYHDGSGYDKLDRLMSFARGTLNGTKDGLTGSAGRSQDWSLDALGNWDSVTDETSTTQTRTHDDQNRLTGVSGASSPTYSPNGEMLSDETGQVLAFDAWGRLVAVDVDADSVVDVAYAYDALNRKALVDEGSGEKAWYYTQQWQVLEERDASSGDVEVQYVWSPVYVDAMVLRDADTDGDGDTQDAGGSERLYVLHDANFNITALTDVAGIVQERFVYDPYGGRTVLNADWTVDTDGLSDVAFVHGHQGGRHYLATGLVDFRNRHLDTSLGRWERQDPAGYVDGASTYQAYGGSASTSLDPDGRKLIFGGEAAQAALDLYNECKEKASKRLRKLLRKIERSNKVRIEAVRGAPFIVDNFDTGQIDMDDIEAFPESGKGMTDCGALIHAVVEQASRKIKKREYPEAHKKALAAEAEMTGNDRVAERKPTTQPRSHPDRAPTVPSGGFFYLDWEFLTNGKRHVQTIVFYLDGHIEVFN